METPLIVASLLITAIWAVYLLPRLLGDRRDAPLSSTEEFDRWATVMADVQRRQDSERIVNSRDAIRNRRRMTMVGLAAVALVTLFLAWWQGSTVWLVVHLFVDALIALYVALLVQMRQRRQWRMATTHIDDRAHAREENQVRVIAN